MTVFVVQEATHDISPAAKFGELRHINRFYIHGDELIADAPLNLLPGWTIPPGYRLNMERAALEFDPDGDYLLIYGDHLQLLAFTMILTAKFHYLSVLRWDRNMKEYIPVRLYSGLVPPGQAVLASGHNIGETEHGESRLKDPGEIDAGPIIRRHAQVVALESPVHRGPKRSS